MAHFQEGILSFEFGLSWHGKVCKFNEHRDYKKVVQGVEETKGVDFLGILKGRLYFIEVKDYRGRVFEKDRLLLEVSQKVRDSVACIIAAYQTSSEPEFWQPYAELLLNRQRPIRVVLWLERDVSLMPRRGSKRRESEKLSKLREARKGVRDADLKRKLRWLTSQVAIGSLNESEWSGLDCRVRSVSRTATP